MTRRILSEQTLEFVIPGKPLGSGSPVGSRKLIKQGIHNRQGADGYRSLISMIAKTAIAEQGWNEPCYILVTIYLGNMKNLNKKQRAAFWESEALPTRRPTCSKILQHVMAALKGLAWKDDRQVVGVLVAKKYRKEEGVEVLLGYPKNWRELNHDLRNA